MYKEIRLFLHFYWGTMAIERNNYRLDVVTSSPARADAFRTLLGPDRVRQILPHFTEDIIRKPNLQKPHEWPMEMAERKALQDIAALMVLSYVNQTVETGHLEDVPIDGKRVIRLYSDTVNTAFATDTSNEINMILEKPKSIPQWLSDPKQGVMAMSGKNFEICTALTAIDMTDPTLHPTTILIRINGSMKPFTIADVKQFILKYGEENILKSASGISFINDHADLFDTNEPLKIYIQTDADASPNLLFELPTWDTLPQKDRLRLLYGALPEALDMIIDNFHPAYPPKTQNGRKQ